MNVNRSRAGSARDRDPARELRRVHTSIANVQTELDAAVVDSGNALAALTTAVNDGLAAKAPTAHSHTLSDLANIAANTILMNASGGSARPAATTVGALPDLDTSDEEATFLLGRDKTGSLGKLSLADLRSLLA